MIVGKINHFMAFTAFCLFLFCLASGNWSNWSFGVSLKFSNYHHVLGFSRLYGIRINFNRSWIGINFKEFNATKNILTLHVCLVFFLTFKYTLIVFLGCKFIALQNINVLTYRALPGPNHMPSICNHRSYRRYTNINRLVQIMEIG